jgi:uncharacterized protein YeaC (DUF1315 family)
MPIPPSANDVTAPDGLAAYRPRDVVNAPAVKAAILARSAGRGDDADMAAWLQNHFFRWAIGSFDYVVTLRSAADFQALGTGDAPAWLLRQLDADPSKVFHHLDPDHPLLVDRERTLVEFLRSRQGTRLAQKLQRINCFQAMALWEHEHRHMQAKRRKGWVPSSGQALKEVLRTPNGTVFELRGDHPALREEMAYESYHMQHCLGQFADAAKLEGGYGEQYARDAEMGRLRLFTLRNAANLPHVTISLAVRDDGLHIDQIKGKQNRHPVRRYVDDVLCFLQVEPPLGERHADCEGMGLVFEPGVADAAPGRWKFVTDVANPDFLLNVMSSNFHLIGHFADPPPVLQWLLLRVAPHHLERLHRVDPAVAAAAQTLTGAAAGAWQIEGVELAPGLGAAPGSSST